MADVAATTLMRAAAPLSSWTRRLHLIDEVGEGDFRRCAAIPMVRTNRPMDPLLRGKDRLDRRPHPGFDSLG